MKKNTGVLLVNLGTPDSPSSRDVYRYLVEFLTDGRVIDSPWILRQLLVRGLIVPRRFRQSAKSYREIWMPEGSPLKVYGNRVKNLLQNRLGDRYVVELGMRYRSPSIPASLTNLREKGCEKIIVLPLFPQYASATTGSVHQYIMNIVSEWLVIPEMVLIDQYAVFPGLIHAFCASAAPFKLDAYDHILFSFHGLPQRQLMKSDFSKKCCLASEECCTKQTEANRACYSAQCYQTANSLVKALGLPSEKYSISFQSRLGKEPWIQPYTSDTITNLAKQGMEKILVFCPSFVCDCLETLYEIGIEYGEEFKKAGGKVLDLVPGLNDHPVWIEALAGLVKEKNE